MNKIYNVIIENDVNIKGYAIVGRNNSGKTFQLLETIANIENSDSLPQSSYVIKDFIFFSKEMNHGKIKNDSALGSKIKAGKGVDFSFLNNYSEIIIDFKNDQILSTPFKDLIFYEIENNYEEYLNLFQEYLDIFIEIKNGELFITSDGIRSPLESSGFISLVRTFVILKNLLNSSIKFLLLDEADDSLDFLNRANFIVFLEKIKLLTNCNAKIIFVTHNPETLFNLPPNYKILKLERNKNEESLEIFYSQDFTSKPLLENNLFGSINRNFYESERLFLLVRFYKEYLTNKKLTIQNLQYFNFIEYDTLSFKEKVIYNSLKKLIGEY